MAKGSSQGFWKTYVLPGGVGAMVVVMLVFSQQQAKDVDALEASVSNLRTSLAEAKAQHKIATAAPDPNAQKEVLNARSVSAKQIGEEMIKVDNVLTAFYKSSEDLPADQKAYDRMVAELDAAKAMNTRLTGADEAMQIQTWQLNPEWTLSLESVLTYQDTDQVPVLFRMTMKNGKDAGLITATYDVLAHQLIEIARHYTVDGLHDEVNVGGA